MSYETLYGMGYVTSGECSQIGGGVLRCYRRANAPRALGAGCVRIGNICDVTSQESGETWCCPGTAVASQTAISTTATKTAILAPSIAETNTGSSHLETEKTAAVVAIKAAADAENKVLPIQQAPGASPAENTLQQYMPHITLASTTIGLITFLGWVLLRNR